MNLCDGAMMKVITSWRSGGKYPTQAMDVEVATTDGRKKASTLIRVPLYGQPPFRI